MYRTYLYSIYGKTFERENFRGCAYTAKPLRGKTFAVVHKIHYSLANFRGASGHGLYTASDSREKLSRSAEKLQNHETVKVFPLESLAVYSMTNTAIKYY